MTNQQNQDERTITINLPSQISLPMVLGVLLLVSFVANLIMWNRSQGTTQTPNANTQNDSGLIKHEALIRNISVAEVTEEDYIRGNADARFVVIEYSDFDCPFCTRFHSAAQEIVDRSNGEVAWVFRHFPLVMIHPNARAKAEAAECVGMTAGNDKFWEYADALYDASSGQVPPVGDLAKIAGEIGINMSSWQNCVDAKDGTAKVNEDLSSGEKAKVTGTPGNVVVDRQTGDAVLISGNIPNLVTDVIEEFKGLN